MTAVTVPVRPSGHNVAERVALERVIERLRAQFPGTDPTRVEVAVRNEADRFDGAPIRDFVPILVERSARTRLHEAGLRDAPT